MTDEELEGEVATLRYFWQEKGDVTRYVGWEELRPVLRERRPEIVKAWDDYVESKRRLSAVLR